MKGRLSCGRRIISRGHPTAGFPGVVRAVPRTFSALPCVVRAVPRTFSALPRVVRAVPRTSPPLPRVVRAVPCTFLAVPRVVRAVPRTFLAVPPLVFDRRGRVAENKRTSNALRISAFRAGAVFLEDLHRFRETIWAITDIDWQRLSLRDKPPLPGATPDLGFNQRDDGSGLFWTSAFG